MTTIGFIGLGHMGGHMARNLIAAGYPVVVHDIRREAAEELILHGAKWAETAFDTASAADVLITMLPGPRQVESVLTNCFGGLKPGSTWIDMSTSTPEAARRIGTALDLRGVHRLDAPVSGMARGASTGMLQIFVGGDKEHYLAQRPVLEAMGDPQRIFHIGAHGTGYTTKLTINLLWFMHLVAAAEVLTLGVKGGVDLQVLRAALIASPANSNFLENDIRGVLEDGDYDESFAMALACKDLGLAIDLGRDVGMPIEVSALVEQIYRRAKAMYGETSGEMIPLRLYEDIAKVQLRVGGVSAE